MTSVVGGLDRDLQRRRSDRYDKGLEERCKKWIYDNVGEWDAGSNFAGNLALRDASGGQGHGAGERRGAV